MSLDIDSYELKEIRDICDINCSSYSQKESWNFFNYLDTKNITKGKIDEIKYLDPLEDTVPSRAKRKVNNKDIIYSTVRPNQEHYGLIENQPDNFLVSTGFTTLKVDTEKAIPEYVYYFITQNHITESLQTIAEQSTTSYPSIRPSDIGDLLIPLPPLGIQNKISSILRNIDYKIKLNEQINKNLEAIASNIFKNYFIDFEPFQELTLIDSNIGNIPKEWEFTKIEDIIDVKDGTHDSPSAIDGGFPLITSKHLNEYDVNKNEANRISFEDYTNINKRSLVEPFDILISMIGTVGNICYIMYDEVDFAIKNVGLFKTSQTPLIREYLLLYLKSSIINHYIDSRLAGSTQKYISLTELRNIPIVIPPNGVLKEFKNIVNPIFNNIKINHFEINNLIKLRDTLLPKLMSGEIDVNEINCDLKILIKLFIISFSNYLMEVNYMKTKIISKIQNQMKPFLNQGQYLKLTNSLLNSLKDIEIIDNNNDENEIDNLKLLTSFLSAKQVEGRSEKTIAYYQSTLEKMLTKINKQVYNITTDEIRKYLYDYKNEKNSSKITIDNMRRIFSSFFSWLEDEDYILKNPVKRIHRVKTGRVVKEVLTDENLEVLRDNCKEIRDLAIVEILISTGIRVGELVRLNIEDINFYERECVVFGKGESERVVYFDARTKIHLMEYIESRTDENPALFVSLNKPNKRLGISGVETRLRELGNKCNISKVHPHKFRRTLATNAIDKGMPIEQVQKLLGHVQIDTTMQYAMVNQSNVKIAHRKFIS